MVKLIQYLFSSRTLPIIICTSLMLFFLGIYFLVAFKSKTAIRAINEEQSIIIELKNNQKENTKDSLISELSNIRSVKENSIQFIPRAEALDIMKEELGLETSSYQEENPFLDVIQLTVDRQQFDRNSLNDVESSVYINSITVKDSFSQDLISNIKRFSWISLLIGIFFTLLALLLIYNAINLSLMESRSTFHTLNLLGADWSFIKRPFLQRAFYVGIFSAIISAVFFLGIIVYLKIGYAFFDQLVSWFNLIVIVIILGFIGLIVNMISANIILNRFLGLKEEEVYQ